MTEGSLGADSAARNKAAARAFFSAIDRLDRRALAPFYHDNFALLYPGNEKALDREAHWQLIAAYHAGFSDMAHRVDILVAEGDRVVARGTILGTNDGPLMGQPPTGKRVDVQFMTMMTFDNGKLVQLFSLIDTAMLQKQLAVGNVLYVSR